MTRKLGDRSSLEVLKKEAKRWLKRVRSGDPRARARLLESYAAAPAEPTLRDVQHALSRELGAKNWRKLPRAATSTSSRPAPSRIATRRTRSKWRGA